MQGCCIKFTLVIHIFKYSLKYYLSRSCTSPYVLYPLQCSTHFSIHNTETFSTLQYCMSLQHSIVDGVIYNPLSNVTQKRIGLSLLPLRGSSSHHLRKYFLATVASDLLIWDLNLNPYLGFCKAVSKCPLLTMLYVNNNELNSVLCIFQYCEHFSAP